MRSSPKGSAVVNEDGVGGAPAGNGDQGGGREGRRGQKSLKRGDKLGALSSVFPFGKSLCLDTSPSGDQLALVSGPSGESLFTQHFFLVSMRNGSFYLTTLLTFHFQLPAPPESHWAWVPFLAHQ